MARKPTYEELEQRVKESEQEKERIEESLKDSEEKFRTILDNVEDSYLEVDLKGIFQFCNDSFCKLLGYARDELMGMDNRTLLDKANAEKVLKIFSDVYTTRKPVAEATWEVIRKDGIRRHIEASVALMRDKDGNPIGFRGIGRDVTDRKEMIETLALNEARFRDISMSMADWIWEVDREGKYTYTAGNFKEVLGYEIDEILGKTPFDFMPEPEVYEIQKVFFWHPGQEGADH